MQNRHFREQFCRQGRAAEQNPHLWERSCKCRERAAADATRMKRCMKMGGKGEAFSFLMFRIFSFFFFFIGIHSLFCDCHEKVTLLWQECAVGTGCA